MHNVKILLYDGEKNLKAEKGTLLLDLLAQNEILIASSCGGKGTCGKCKVEIIQDDLNNATKEVVLSCKYQITSNITVKVNNLQSQGIIQSYSIDFETQNQKGLGIALDLGTTTLAAYLIDLETQKEIKTVSQMNKQAIYGSDVISRIEASSNGHLKNLQRITCNQINIIISSLLGESKERVSKILVSGNTTMLHLLLGVDPSPMGFAPFKPHFLSIKRLKGRDIGINCEDIILMPSTSAFIGSDIVSGIISCDLINKKGVSLFIDIGTNGEIVLCDNGRLSACSTAAGPAFEGANIEMGMGAVPNAIDHIKLENGKLNYSTISGQAYGICGSGLIDLIAILIDSGIVDENGTFTQNNQSALSDYLRQDKFYITENVYITQNDIRQFQLAKSALCSGIITLLKENNLQAKTVDRVYLAGGFGFYLNKENAIKIGILPSELSNVKSIGNSSGQGAKMCLANDKYLQKGQKVAKSIKIVDLTVNKTFVDNFIDNMSFIISN